MTNRFAPIGTRLLKLLHGGDYNPDQWLHAPEVLQDDLRLMKLARCNAMSIGIFAWSSLEPEEGRFTFDWLDRVLDSLAREGIFAILATPSGARPAWLSQRYPEVLRVSPERRRNLHGIRHNHCYTSPVYREKVRIINEKLAEKYGRHPALLLWHVSNEYGGECHCDLCQAAFREWLKREYADDLGRLNLAWWTSFWSHTFTAWDQVESPAPHGEPFLPGLTIDWARFVTHQTVDFLKAEIEPLKRAAPAIPVTTNMMGTYPGIDYWKMAPCLDMVSLDSYPQWHGLATDWKVAADTAFTHDIMRSLKAGAPYLLMETAPTFSNWWPVWKLKKPGVHALTSLLAVSRGSDSVQYFQWRSGRGGVEKFHGAVVDHSGSEHTRVFREVAELGSTLETLSPVRGTAVPAETAIVFDWENWWALQAACITPRSGDNSYEAACRLHHEAFFAMAVPTDVIDMEQDFMRYRLLVAPLLYMVKPGVADRLEAFVRAGGVLVATCRSGIVDRTDLCFPGTPGPLRSLLGIRVEETDGLYPDERNRLVMERGNSLGLKGAFKAGTFCDLVFPETASVLARYGSDFYAGKPALTENRFERGSAFYLACGSDARFLSALYGLLVRRLGIRRALDAALPAGVSAQVRTDGDREFLFLLNFSSERRVVTLDRRPCHDLLAAAPSPRRVSLEGYGYRVLERGHG